MAGATQHPAGMPTTPREFSHPNLPPNHGLAGSTSPHLPPVMPTPSFCQVTSGLGTPVASQDSTTLVLTITITTPGRGFKAGGSTSSREVLPTWDSPRWTKAQGFRPQERNIPCTASRRCFWTVPAAFLAVQV